MAARESLSTIEDEWSDIATCIACAVPMWPEAERAFACDADSYVCFRCAERRGGVYDEKRDAWTVAPDVSDVSAHLASAANE